jgi:hypothetical protein
LPGAINMSVFPTIPPTGTAKCPPPPATYRANAPFPLAPVNAPATVATLNCDATHLLTAGVSYNYATVNLLPGCGISNPTSTLPVTIYGTTINLGAKGGGVGAINAPSTTTCPGTSTWTYQDSTKNPSVDYCTGWSSKLQIFVPGGKGGTINVRGPTLFWGVVNAPDGTLNINSPQFEMWGSMVLNSLAASAQFSWHYDTSNADIILPGSYQITNWREEHL